MLDLRARETHFEFGANWLQFQNSVNSERVKEAIRGLERLFPDGELKGKRFLDIGCGSGLSMLAALMLGARDVVGVDIDENSVEAARRLLSRHAPGEAWRVSQQSIFELGPDTLGRFDVVYSWGVLHHTGAMWDALDRASALVDPNGFFAVALYRKTPLCEAWRIEKRLYSRMPRPFQALWRSLFETLAILVMLIRGRNPVAYVANYRKNRGMSWSHDVHDWLGGYPYESVRPDEIHSRFHILGLRLVREFVLPPGRGLLGSGCDEYVARRAA